MQIAILVDDATSQDAVKAEHGLAVLVAGSGRRVLFDAGAGGATLSANAAAMGVDLGEIDTAVLSHGHYDHTGGLETLAAASKALKLYAHPSVWRKRWVEESGKPLKDVSCPHSLHALASFGAAFHAVEGPQKLEDWLILSGPVGGPKYGREIFVVNRNGDMVVDGFEDEIFCLVRGERGWTVVSGCCHRGLKNTLRSARFLAHGEPLAAILGGMHLCKANGDDLREAVELLKEAGLPDVYPCHCSGEKAVAYLAEQMPGKVHPLSAGKTIVL